MIAELQEERLRLTEAIEALERLSHGTSQKKRGRPPKWRTSDRSKASPESARPSDDQPILIKRQGA
jgi:hypothetical protein